MRAKIDEAMEKLKAQGRIDFEKEFLGNLGPRMALYLAPGRSAATTDETPEGAVKAGGIDPMAMFSSLQSALPKPTLVAELRDPVAFSKALDVLMITREQGAESPGHREGRTGSRGRGVGRSGRRGAGPAGRAGAGPSRGGEGSRR